MKLQRFFAQDRIKFQTSGNWLKPIENKKTKLIDLESNPILEISTFA